jgi:hypothetical protein
MRMATLLIPAVLGTDAIAPIVAHLQELVRAAWDAWTPETQWDESGVVRLGLEMDDARFNRSSVSLDRCGIGRRSGLPGERLSLRASIPGYGHQGLHPDYFPDQRTDGSWQVLAGMWCLSEFTHNNGPLRFLPGSHRSRPDPSDDMEWVGMGPHPNEVKVLCPAGSLILFNSASLWHSQPQLPAPPRGNRLPRATRDITADSPKHERYSPGTPSLGTIRCRSRKLFTARIALSWYALELQKSDTNAAVV